jgi:non-specific serine/threonine protein kinase
LGDVRRTSAVLRDLGRLDYEAGDWERGRSLFEESLALERRSGNESGIALTRSLLGLLALLRGEYGPARAHLEESLEVLRGLGGTNEIKRCLLFLGYLACDRGEYATARARLAEVLEGDPLRQYRFPAPFILLGYARLAAGEGQAARALRLAGAAAALRQTIGTSMGPAYQTYLRRGLELAWQALGEEAGEAAWAEGQRMTLEQAVAYALEAPATPQEEEDSRPPIARVKSVGTEPRPEETHPESLTAREAEVLGLLAGSKTNKEIAHELVLSVSTVQRHIANIYAKIGAHNRVEATAYALRHGIDEARPPERFPSR